MKDSYYSYHLKNYTKKEVDKVWENIIKKYQVILEPLFQACSGSSHELEKVEGSPSSALNFAIKQYQEAQFYRNWLDPLKINFGYCYLHHGFCYLHHGFRVTVDH